ncbi:hypothetical protein TNCV_4558011, partial [Trichonephila clavipes]
MSSSPVPLKPRRVGERCTLNLSRAQMSSCWSDVAVKRGQLKYRPRHLTMVQNYKFRLQRPSSEKLTSSINTSFISTPATLSCYRVFSSDIAPITDSREKPIKLETPTEIGGIEICQSSDTFRLLNEVMARLVRAASNYAPCVFG